MLLSPGIANKLTSKCYNCVMFGEVDQDDFDLQMKAVAGKNAAETMTLGGKFLNYSNINRKKNFAFSETLLDLLSHISLKDFSA